MGKAMCWNCAADFYLSKLIRDTGKRASCSVCNSGSRKTISIEELGELLEPIVQAHYRPGGDVKRFGADDAEWWQQEGDSASDVLQEILGDYYGFEDEIIEAVLDAQNYRPQDGDEPVLDSTTSYVPVRIGMGRYSGLWWTTLDELKHRRRFFSPSAKELFGALFSDLEVLTFQKGTSKGRLKVVRRLPAGKKLFRARMCRSTATVKEVWSDPLKHVGPPPPEQAHAGRMNADGVVVFYAALDVGTCLAEMRPAIGTDLAVITVTTTRPLRILDFSRLESARHGRQLSYFQPDFKDEVAKSYFLRHLHKLISQPVVPGRESDYLITQTMAEYLAHVHEKPFDGVMFSSAQRANGKNIVLFGAQNILNDSPADVFSLSYVADSVRLFTNLSVSYKHRELSVHVDGANIWIHRSDGDPEDDDSW